MSQGFTKGIPIDKDPTLANNSDLVVPSQAAVKTYVGNLVSNSLYTNNIKTISGHSIIGSGNLQLVPSDVQLSNVTDDLQFKYSNFNSSDVSFGGSPSGRNSYVPSEEVLVTYVNNAIAGGIDIKGGWNANSNNPNLGASIPASGDAYVVTTPGTTNLNGITSWSKNDIALYTSTAGWIKIDNSTATLAWGSIGGSISSQNDLNSALNSKVTSSTNSVSKNSIPVFDYSIDPNGKTIKDSNCVITPSTTSISNTSSDLEVPTSLAVYNAINDATNSTINSVTGSSPINANTTAGAVTISIAAASSIQNGYLTTTNFNTFNGKEPAITAGTTAQYYRGDKTFQTLNTAAVPESTSLYFTNSRAQNAISLTTTNSNGAATYNSGTGVFNIPNYTLSGLGGQPSNSNLTSLGSLSYVSGAPLISMTAANTFALDTNTYIKSGQTITLSGDVTSSSTSIGNTGATSISTTLSAINQGNNAINFVKINLDSKGRVIANTSVSGTDISTAIGSQAANTFYAAPNNSAGTPSFRTIVSADIPTLNQNTTGQAGSVAQSVTFDSVAGGPAGTTFNGSTARTIGYDTVGAAASTHSHGQISSAGAIGTAPDLIVKTGASGVLTTLATGTAGQFLQYNGTWATPPTTNLAVSNQGTSISTSTTSINFTGAGVTATGSGSVTVNIPGGGSGNINIVYSHISTF